MRMRPTPLAFSLMAAALLTACPGPVYRSIPCGILDGDVVDADTPADIDQPDDDALLPDITDDDVISPVILQWGTPGDEGASAIEAAPDGALFVTGGTTGELFGNQSRGSSDIFLTKITPARAFAWTRQWGTLNFDEGLTLTRDTGGALYLSGWRNGIVDPISGAGIGTMFISRLTADGGEQWDREWGSFDQNYPTSASADAQGTVYVTGWAYGTVGSDDNLGLSDIFLSRFDKEGAEPWSVQWGSGLIDVGYGVAAAGSGGAYVTGWTYGALGDDSTLGRNDVFLSRVTADGAVEWTRQWGSYGEDRSYAIVLDAKDAVYLAGSTTGGVGGFSNIGGLDCFLVKFSAEGDLVWAYQWGTDADEEVFALALAPDGSLYAAGYANASLAGTVHRGKRDILISRFSAGGEPLGHALYGTTDDETALSVRAAPPYLLVAGWTGGDLGAENAGGYDIFVLFHPLP